MRCAFALFLLILFPVLAGAQTHDAVAPIPAEFCKEPGIRALMGDGYTITCFDPLVVDAPLGVCSFSGRCDVVVGEKTEKKFSHLRFIDHINLERFYEDMIFAFLPPESRTAHILLELKPFTKIDSYTAVSNEAVPSGRETFSQVCVKIPALFSFLRPFVGERECALAQTTKERTLSSLLLESTTTTQVKPTAVATSTPAQAFLSAEPRLVQLGARAIISWGSTGVLEGTCRVQGADGFVRFGEAGQVSSEPITGKSFFVLGCLTEDKTPVIRTLVVDLAS